jgi:hypothetical protein
MMKAAEREKIARQICYDSGMFDTVAEIRANLDHPIVRAAYAEADRRLAAGVSFPASGVNPSWTCSGMENACEQDEGA